MPEIGEGGYAGQKEGNLYDDPLRVMLNYTSNRNSNNIGLDHSNLNIRLISPIRYTLFAVSRASTSAVNRTYAFLVPSGLNCQHTRTKYDIPDKSVDFQRIDII
jgi:hypothetical protein